MTKEDKCEEQLDRGPEKGAGEGLMYMSGMLGERRNVCWRTIFNH